MFFDLINDAIAKAKTELEKSVDTALGIEKEQEELARQTQGAHNGASVAKAPQARQALTGGENAVTLQQANGKLPTNPNGSQAGAAASQAPAQAPKVVKKVVKKIIKKVPKQPADGVAKVASTELSGLQPSASMASTTDLGALTEAAAAVALPASGPGSFLISSTESEPARPTGSRLQESSSLHAAASLIPDINSQPIVATPQLHKHTSETAAQNGDHSATSHAAQGASHSAEQMPVLPADLLQPPVPQHTASETSASDAAPDSSNAQVVEEQPALPSQAGTSTSQGLERDALAPRPSTSRQRSRKQSLDVSAPTLASQSIGPSSQGDQHNGDTANQGTTPHGDSAPEPASHATSVTRISPHSDTNTQDPAAHGGSGLTSPHGPTITGRASMAGSDTHLPEVEIPSEVESMPHGALVALVAQLQQGLAVREQRLVRQAAQACEMQQVVAQLQDKNEALALKAARISEQDWEEMRKEFEQRLATAERKVYALSKERDALKRGNEKLSDYGALIKEKDGIIKQVMDEGERLSARQAELEGTLKRMRGQIKDLEMEKDQFASKLSSEESASEALRRAKAKLERDLQAAQEQAAHDLEQARLQADSLLLKARSDQAEAEDRAREAANAGLHRRLRESEARAEALSETVIELREALDRQRQAADLREEMLKQDLADLERRCQGAELRHQELAAKLPDATRPLLRQIEAMQAAADAQSGAWAAAEQSLATRIEDAEGRAAAAAERERHATERAQTLQARAAGLEAALGAARAELKSLAEQVDLAAHASQLLQEQLQDARQAAHLEAEHCRLAKQQLQQAEEKHSLALSMEHQARAAAEGDAATVRREYERRLGELEAQLADTRGPGGGMFGGDGSRGDPPAMAAPGYRWVLQREGEPSSPQHASRQQPGQQEGHHSTPANAQQDHSGFRGSSPPPVDASAPDLMSSLVPASTGSGLPLASELESMRAALRIRGGEAASLEAQVRALEATRDRLSEELVSAAQRSEEASTALATVESLRHELHDLKTRYVAAVELLGERDEALEELRADLMDVKNLYRDQIEFMVMQLTTGTIQERAEAVQESTPVL